MFRLKINKNKFIKGSGIIVVIFAGVATSVYMISTFADYEHLTRMQNNYSENLKKTYEERIENLDDYYEFLADKTYKDENFILE